MGFLDEKERAQKFVISSVSNGFGLKSLFNIIQKKSPELSKGYLYSPVFHSSLNIHAVHKKNI